VTAGWFLFALLAPPIAAAVAGVVFRHREAHAVAVIALNTIAPGSGLIAAHRPVLEVVLGVLFAQASLLVAGGPENAFMLVPMAVAAGVWASFHTPLNPIVVANSDRLEQRLRELQNSVSPASTAPAVLTDHSSATEPDVAENEAGYAIAVKCTECGADVDVPVLAHMANCTFCGSNHLVIGHEETLYVTLPDQVTDSNALTNVVLDHLRYRRYLELYRRTVAPLEAGTADMPSDGALVTRREGEAAVAAAEAAASRRADAYRAKLAASIEVKAGRRFLAPYRHGVGTLFQVAFGRTPSSRDKELRFAIRTVEAARIGSSAVDLPAMGKLSYLRAMKPAALCPESTRSLPLDTSDDDLRQAFGNLDRKRLVRDLDVIRLGVAFSEEVAAVIWRPWWLAEVVGPGIHESLLVDCAAASVARSAPHIPPETLVDLPPEARDPGGGLRFIPMECPTCGHEFPFDIDAMLHFCTNCHRVCRVEGTRKHHVAYGYDERVPTGPYDLAPFWCFPLNLRSREGEIVTDLAHFKDGIDGTLDQLGGDAVQSRHLVVVPGFRCINSRLMATAFGRVFIHTLRHPPRLQRQRFPSDEQPQPWSVSLDETEARKVLPLYLAHALSPRDIARVKVDQVVNWIFEARQDEPGELVYLPLPRSVTEPFRRYVGRYRSRAVRRARTAKVDS
jgi:hypothetical protein